MFRLASVEFRDSAIAGRGVFARRHFKRGDRIVAYAPKQRKIDVRSPDAALAAQTKLTLLSEERWVIVPDTSVPGGWLCNHSCSPNAAVFSSGEGRIQCTTAIVPGEEITIFYGWVTHNEPKRDPCRCGSPSCRGFINFDLSDEDAKHVEIGEGNQVVMDAIIRAKLAEYGEFLHSIGQEQVQEIVANTLVRMKMRKSGSIVCAF